MRKAIVLAVAAGLLCAGSAHAVVILQDDFESYADTPAMTAVWSGGPGTLDTVTGNPGKSMFHPGGTVNNQTSFSATPTDAQPIVWEFDMYWDGAGNKRITGGLRTTTPDQILEMGYYNAAAEGSGFAYRTVLMTGSTNWHLFPSSPAGFTPRWMTFRATIRASDVTFQWDADNDGTFEDTVVVAAQSPNPYNDVRFGGPSNLSSGGGGANFDNLLIEQVPEPASLMLLGLGGLFLARRRRTA